MKKGFWGKPRKQTVCLSRQVVLSGKRKEDKEAMKGKFNRRWSWAGRSAASDIKSIACDTRK